MTRLLQRVDHNLLSPTSKATRILIGEPMTEGFSLSEIAAELKQPTSWVSERLSSLRNELLLKSGLFFPLADSEYEALRESIRRHGIRSPILIGEHIALLDGRHRLLIAEELGLEDAPALFLTGLSAEAERELAIGLNAARRQLTIAQKRSLVEMELHLDPARSNTLIASICGVSHPTVGAVRAKLAEAELAERASTELTWAPDETTEAIGDLAFPRPAPTRRDATAVLERPRVDPERRVDASGRPQAAHRPLGDRPTRAPERIDYVTCAHGQVHSLYREGSSYRIVVEDD